MPNVYRSSTTQRRRSLLISDYVDNFRNQYKKVLHRKPSVAMNHKHERKTSKVTRIAILNSHPIQYFAPLYAYLNAAPDLDLTALYLSDVSIRGGKDTEFGRDVKWDIDLLAGYDSVFLGEAAQIREPAGFWSLIAPQVWREVRSGRYDALWVHGHNYAANLIGLVAAKSAGLPVMMRGDTHLGLRSRS